MLRVQDVKMKYGKTLALNGVSLSFEAGEFVALMGPNGSGKSTLMRLLAQTEFADSGEIHLNGKSLRSPFLEVQPSLAFVSEDRFLPQIDSLNVWAKKFYKEATNPRFGIFEELIRIFNVDGEKKFREFSRGQKMKAIFALQAIRRPNIYVLDEITSVLDSGSRFALMNFLSDERARGALILMSTNIAGEMQAAATRVCFLSKGSVEFDAKVVDLEKHFTKVISKEMKSPSKKFRLVSSNSDGSWSYLGPKTGANEAAVDRRAITVEDVAKFFTGPEGGV